MPIILKPRSSVYEYFALKWHRVIHDPFYFTFLQYPRTPTRIHESGIYVKSRHSESLHSALCVVVVAKEISASQLSRTRGTHNKRVVHRIPRARTRAHADARIAPVLAATYAIHFDVVHALLDINCTVVHR